MIWEIKKQKPMTMHPAMYIGPKKLNMDNFVLFPLTTSLVPHCEFL